MNAVYRGIPVTLFDSNPPNSIMDFYSGSPLFVALARHCSPSSCAGDMVVYNFSATNSKPSLLPPFDLVLWPNLLIVTTATGTIVNTHNPWADKLGPVTIYNAVYVEHQSLSGLCV